MQRAAGCRSGTHGLPKVPRVAGCQDFSKSRLGHGGGATVHVYLAAFL